MFFLGRGIIWNEFVYSYGDIVKLKCWNLKLLWIFFVQVFQNMKSVKETLTLNGTQSVLENQTHFFVGTYGNPCYFVKRCEKSSRSLDVCHRPI